MTKFTPINAFTPRELRAMDTDRPLSPPSTDDELVHKRKRAEIRQRILRRLREKFPSLPY